MTIQFSRTRYTDDLLTEQDGEKIYEIRKNILEIEDKDSIEYTIMEGQSIRDISFEVYESTIYWWIIADVINVYNPFEKLIGGRLIVLPSLRKIQEDII